MCIRDRARTEAYLHAKFHLDASKRLATIHIRYRQTDRQRSDSIVRTVLQTVAQKPQVPVTVTQGVSVVGVAGWLVILTGWLVVRLAGDGGRSQPARSRR